MDDLKALGRAINYGLTPTQASFDMSDPLLSFFRAVPVNNPEMNISGFAPLSHAHPKQDLMGINLPWIFNQKHRDFVKHHEATHLWAGRSGETRWKNANKYFNPRDLYDSLLKDTEILLEKYPILRYSGYFTNQEILKALPKEYRLEELVSDLAAVIRITGKDLTRDPDITTFRNPIWREWFDSVTGYRSTRWDPRDQGVWKIRPENLK